MKSLAVVTTPLRVAAVKILRPLWGGVVYSPISTLHYLHIQAPAVPSRWLRVKNSLAGICGSDLHVIFLDADMTVHPAILPRQQVRYLGHEVVGRVQDAPPGSRLQPGDRVIRHMRVGGGSCLAHGLEPCGNCARMHYNHCERTGLPDTIGGGFSDEFFCPEGGVMSIPDDLTDDQAILVEPAACAIRGVLRCPPEAGEKVLVFGMGTMGFFVLQVLRVVCPDCRIIAVAEFDYQKDLALLFGADEVWMAAEDLLTKGADETGGTLHKGFGRNRTLCGGFDRVYDCVGSSGTLTLSLRLARAGGSVLLVGVTLKPMTVDLTPVWYNEVNLMGTVSFSVSLWKGENVGNYDLAIRWIREGTLDTRGMITHRYPLEQYREAIDAAVHKSLSRSVKVAFTYS